jgi:hypothetical protein
MSPAALLNLASAVMAVVDAGLWLKSATIKTPEKINSGYGGSGGSMQQLGDAIRRQSRWSAGAAIAAAIAALLQAVAMIEPMTR